MNSTLTPESSKPMEVEDLILAELKSLGGKQDDMAGKLDAYMLESNGRLTWLETQVKLRVGNGQPGMCAQHLATIHELDKSMDRRVTELERWRAWVLGIVAAVGAILGATATWLGLSKQ